MRKVMFVVLIAGMLVAVAAAAGMSADAPAVKTAAPVGAGLRGSGNVKVSVEADDAKLSELIAKVADQSKKKIVVESTVKGTVPHMSLKDVTVEAALSTICKSGKCDWRKVYLPSDSKLLEQPERLASTVRLVSAMGFPEIVIAGASNGKLAVHYTQEKSVKSVQDLAVNDSALTEVYVITNDAAVAEKEKSSKALEDYVKQQKDMMDKFIKMTPEEQEQAMLAGINQFENVDPGYMASVMRTFSKMDPEVFARMQNRGTDMLLAMSQEDRRAMMKMSMRAQKFVNPEVQKMLQEDAKAVMEEMKAEQEQNPNPNPNP